MDPTIKRWSTERKRKRKTRRGLLTRAAALQRGIKNLGTWITRRQTKLAKQNTGARALAYAGKFVGKTESPPGSNDAPFLREWRENLKPRTLDWMKGQPWCGLGCIAAWYFGAGVRLPDGVVFTPNIVAWANRGERFTRIKPENARAGDLVVFNFVGGSSVADHVGLARGPARGGVIPTREANTVPSNSGSQADGGGWFDRSRPVGLIAVVARPKEN